MVLVADPKMQQYTNHRLDDSTSAQTTLDVASRWILECSSTHERCMGLSRKDYHPTRLLELDGPYFLLVDGSSLGAGDCYATLSHCWGIGNHTE